MLRRVLASAALAAATGLAFAAQASATVVAQWDMDEPAGSTTMTDSSGFGNNGVLTGVTTGVPGFSGTDFAYDFSDPNASQAFIKKPVGLAPGANDITITTHVMTTAVPGTGANDFDLISKGGYKIELYPTKKIAGSAQAKCKFNGKLSGAATHNVLQAGPTNLNDGNWHTIICQKTADSVSLTVDGTTFTQAGTVGTINPGGSLYLGRGPNLQDPDRYHGVMDDVVIEIAP